MLGGESWGCPTTASQRTLWDAAARASVPRNHTHSHCLHNVLGGGVCLGSLAPRVLLCTSTHTLVLEGGAPSPVVPQG